LLKLDHNETERQAVDLLRIILATIARIVARTTFFGPARRYKCASPAQRADLLPGNSAAIGMDGKGGA
jgi:hypothetical protein